MADPLIALQTGMKRAREFMFKNMSSEDRATYLLRKAVKIRKAEQKAEAAKQVRR